MKDRAIQLSQEAPKNQRENTLREYLQSHMLRSINQGRGFEQIAFLGGTALRFLYNLQRYSEDLDFSLERKEGYDFQAILEKAASDLRKAGFELTVHPSSGKTVHSAFLRFPRLLYEAGLSPHEDEKLSIKIEIDTNPPSGAETEATVINRHFLLSLWHYDLPSMMAGKVHALLTRDYTKGRDIYDLLWYRTRPNPVKPNTAMLNNSLQQTGWEGPAITDENWKSIVKNKLKSLDWDEVIEDVESFLENPEESRMLTYATLDSAL